ITTEVGNVLRSVGGILDGAIDRHQTQSEEKRPGRLGRSQRTTDPAKERGDRAYSELVTAVSNRTVAGRRHLRNSPDPAHAVSDLLQHVPYGELGVEMESDHQQDDRFHGKLALSGGAGAVGLEHRFDRRHRNGSTNRVQCEGAAELAFRFQVSYSERH